MPKKKSKTKGGQNKVDWDIEEHYRRNVQPMLDKCPWVLRVTEYKGKPVPVFVVKERLSPDDDRQKKGRKHRSELRDRGLIYGEHQRRCLAIVNSIVRRVHDQADVPLELHRFLPSGRIAFRGNLPLDDEAGVKLALIFKLQERVKDIDRVELIARRVDRFGREEAAYWYSRITNFGPAANRWSIAGMKLMLGGQPSDKNIRRMLEKLRASSVG